MSISEQLRLLSIFHYILGGLHALFGCFGLIHFFLGISMLVAPASWASGNSAPPPFFIGLIFTVIGGGFVLFGLTLGICTALSGRFISRRIHRTYSVVLGGINCMMIPFGTVLGVFDIIILTRQDVAELYASQSRSSA